MELASLITFIADAVPSSNTFIKDSFATEIKGKASPQHDGQPTIITPEVPSFERATDRQQRSRASASASSRTYHQEKQRAGDGHDAGPHPEKPLSSLVRVAGDDVQSVLHSLDWQSSC